MKYLDSQGIIRCVRLNKEKRIKERTPDLEKNKHNSDKFYDIAIHTRSEDTNQTTRETINGVRTEGELEQKNKKNVEVK